MKIDREDTPNLGERKRAEMPKHLINPETTIIPSLGVTFSEAEAKTASIAVEDNDAWIDAADAAEAIHTTHPVTMGDALVKLRVLSGPLGLAGGSSGSHIRSVDQISAFLTSSRSDD